MNLSIVKNNLSLQNNYDVLMKDWNLADSLHHTCSCLKAYKIRLRVSFITNGLSLHIQKILGTDISFSSFTTKCLHLMISQTCTWMQQGRKQVQCMKYITAK